MSTKRIGLLALALLLAVSTFSFAAGSQDTAATQTAELTWMSIGPTSKQTDSDEVWALWNEELQNYLPGVSVAFDVMPPAEYGDRFKLAMAAQEEIDIATRFWGQNLLEEVNRGSFLPLDDLLQEHGPDLLANLPEWVFQKGSVDGKIYNIPNYQWMQQLRLALKVPADLADMVDLASIARELEKRPTMDQQSYDLIEPYLANALDTDRIQLGISPTFWWIKEKGYEKVGSGAVIRIDDETPTVMNFFETPEFQAAVRTAAMWFQAGYIRRDILGADIAALRGDDGKTDGSILWVHGQYYTNQSEIDSDRYGFPIYSLPITGYDWIGSGQNSTDLAIPSTARYPEQAMQVINLTQSERGKDMYRLLVYGIEGRHYNIVEGDNVFEPIGYSGSQGTADAPYGLWRWAMGNTQFALLNPVETNYVDEFLRVNSSAIPSPIMGFKPDVTSISTEMAQVKAVENEFHDVLMSGALPDPEATYNDFLEKLDAAGIDTIIAELQRQIDAWR